MNESVIQVSNLWKRYDIRPIHTLLGKGRYLLERITGRREREGVFWALRDVSFEVKRGETLGIIGPNGAGKSTLLKILCGVTALTRGSLRVEGAVAPLIELGAGFHPELTGRENVLINGIILGMSRREMNRKYEQIVEFAELGEFMDTPVKKYSSGMFVRLAFAVAVHTEPDVLLVDEVLSVGDFSFQKKCMDYMRDLMERNNVTVVLVSHSAPRIQTFCSRVILLDHGRVKIDSDPVHALRKYYSSGHGAKAAKFAEKHGRVCPDAPATLVSAALNRQEINTGNDELSLTVSYNVHKTDMKYKMDLGMFLQDSVTGIMIAHFSSRLDDVSLPNTPGEHKVGLRVRGLAHLAPGDYEVYLGLGAMYGSARVRCAFLAPMTTLSVRKRELSKERSFGLIDLAHEWERE